MVDLLLISQQKLVENSINDLKKDPMNLNNSKSIILLCNQAQFFLDQLLSLLNQTKLDEPEKKNRKINYSSVLYTLIANFIANATPVTNCCQLATIFTNNKRRQILQLLNNDFIPDEKLSILISYFDMILFAIISKIYIIYRFKNAN